ncbi:SDR family NAD(P)-dependent oxidoreductase [Streptoalloteichus hindustanus]|uniref:2,3-dihydro-2,3-dihydroxybenzoate dehydrogenase n=1 Tax=Streptoalloteichus hindustanus TaxID=2017 RepID=A0A1M4XKZ4_STRHI|nr:SDR family NAD(P)-dependent oxidoreductase [Streptoalloteichus hindustanus]SHE94244.1 2,3-dihydro-2,3-dihydroxybenzoate dehydrogenase [Streptoalloteichus hindustanus]
MDRRFVDRVAVVTGVATTTGRRVTRALAEAGARVAALDSDAGHLATVIPVLRQHDLHVTGFPVDVTSSSSVDEVVADVERWIGPVEFLVNAVEPLRSGSVLTPDDKDLRPDPPGVGTVSRSIARRMAARGHGAIVTLTSTSAIGSHPHRVDLDLSQNGIRCHVLPVDQDEHGTSSPLWTSQTPGGAELPRDVTDAVLLLLGERSAHDDEDAPSDP